MFRISKDFIINDLNSLKELICNFAPCIETKDVVTFSGEVGVGKTTFIRILLENITDKSIEVSSPTFNLLNMYELNNMQIWHYDLYRLTNEEEIYEIGIEEAFGKVLLLIEWPELISNMLPKDRLDIKLRMINNYPDQRILTLNAHGKWCTKLQNFLESINI